MAFLVQNDSGTVEGANSYSTVEEFKAYWLDRGADYSAKTDEEIQAKLIQATSYLDNRYPWAGYKVNGRSQTTSFPRGELYDCSGVTVVLVEGVPYEIKEAVNEYAYILFSQDSLQPNGSTGGTVKRKKEKVGPLEEEIEYSPPGESGGIISYPQADNKIPECFIARGYFGGSNMAVHT